MGKAVSTSKKSKGAVKFWTERASRSRRVSTALRLSKFILGEDSKISTDINSALEQPNLYMEMISIFSTAMSSTRSDELEKRRKKSKALRSPRRRI